MAESVWEDMPNGGWEDSPTSSDGWEDVPTGDSTSAPVRSGETFPGQDMAGVPMGGEGAIGTAKNPGYAGPIKETHISGEGEVVFPRLESIVTLMKEKSIPKNLINWLTTPEETYRKRERIKKDEFINSIPIVSQVKNRLDEIEWLASQEGYKGNLEDEHNKLIDAYGTLYQNLEKSYDKGELETGFSWNAFTDSLKDDPSGMLAELTNVFMADPELLMFPIGWEYAAGKATLGAKALGASENVAAIAKVTGGVMGTAVLGSGLAVVDNVSRQLSETGKIDQEEVMTSAKIGAVAAPILVAGFKGAKSVGGKGYSKMSDITFNRSFKKAIVRIEKNAQIFMTKGLKDPQRAIERAIDRSFIPNRVREALAKRHDWVRDINLSDEAIDSLHKKISNDSNKLKTVMYKKLASFHKGVQDHFGNLTTEVGLIHPMLRHAIKQLDQRTSTSMKHGLDVKDQFKRVYKGLGKTEQEDLLLALGNRNKSAVSRIIQKSYANLSDKANMQTTIDSYFKDVFNRSEVAGMGMKQLDNFFPMEVKDYAAFAHSLGFSPSHINTSLSKAINSKFNLKEGNKVKSSMTMKEAEEFLSNDEIAQVLNKALKSPFKGASGNTTHSKKRVIEQYTRENIKFYRDPVASFANYVTSMEPKIQETMFFGGKSGSNLPHSGFVSNSIGGMVQKLAANGEIIPDDMARLGELLTARFVEGTRAPNKFIGGLKNILYATTLGNPFSAMTQLGDIGNSAYIVGVMDTVRASASVMTGRGVFKMEDFGLNNIVQEFEHLGTTARVLDMSLKLSGFKAVDRLGKETVLNATLSKYTRIAKSIQNVNKGSKKTKGARDFIKKYQDAFTPEAFNKVIDDLAKGNHTQDVKYLMWHELTRVQPISLSEMPVQYLRHPNARMFYMLKTFTLKQIDLVRREAFHRISSGDVAGGMATLARWTGILGISNASVEQAKAWVKGDEVEFGDLLIAQFWRNYGLSPYVLDQIKAGRPGVAFTTLAMPPVAVFDEPWQDLVNFGERFETLKYVPIAGKALYYMFDMDDK